MASVNSFSCAFGPANHLILGGSLPSLSLTGTQSSLPPWLDVFLPTLLPHPIPLLCSPLFPSLYTSFPQGDPIHVVHFDAYFFITDFHICTVYPCAFSSYSPYYPCCSSCWTANHQLNVSLGQFSSPKPAPS